MNNSRTIATILMTVGILFFIAMAFQVMEWKYAIFAGVACFIIANMVRRLGRT